MAYRNPAFYFYHELSDASAVALSGGSDTPAAGDIALAYDYRQAELVTWSAVNPIAVDYRQTRTAVSAGVYRAFDTLILPASTAMSGTGRVSVFSDTDSGFGTPQAHLSVEPLTVGLQVEPLSDLATITTKSYSSVLFDSSDSSDLDIGEIWLTEKREMSRGPAPGWDISSRSHSSQMTSMAGVDSSRITGASVRTFRLKFNQLSGTDLDLIDDLIATAGTARPFYFTPPDDRYEEVILCKLSRDPQIRQQNKVPSAVGPAYEVQLDLIEVSG